MMHRRTLKTVFILLCVATSLAAEGNEGLIKQEINQGWTFKQVRGNNRYPATVPGVVHTDLLDNALIEDPYFRLNERGVQWVDKEDWEYQTSLHIDEEVFRKEHIELAFMGLDTYADVFLNDSCVLKANNMFREWKVDVKGLVKAGDNVLRVYFRSPIKEDMPKFDAVKYPIDAGNDQSENGGILNKKLSVFARKAGYHYGWDWGPRLVTSGIWRPVYLLAWDKAKIVNVHYLQESITAKRAKVKVRLEFMAGEDGEARMEVRAEGVKQVWALQAPVTKGLNLLETEIEIKNPRLWWSNGLGEAYRYAFTTRVSLAGASDSHTEQVGLRDLKVVREADAAGRSFYFRLNGVNVFAKGANYIPQDNFLPRVTPERYEQTIRDAAVANMNMLRVWGGGVYESDLFYELCDTYGILVWQDFMFACSTYPMNPSMLENVRQEAIDNVRRLRNHACIALWCGNNENHTAWFNWGWMNRYRRLGVLDEMRKDYKDVFDGVLPEVVEAHDPLAFYWPSSPYGGEPDAAAELGKPNVNPKGDAHYWGVWHSKDSIANYNHVRARFFSEYGFQSFPEYQSVLRYAPQSRDHSIFSEVMMAHQRGGRHANALIEWYLLNEYRAPHNFEDFLYIGQVLQGDAIKTAIEAHRRDMPYCMGTLYWQHNDCWPVASWSSRDYYGRWKAQHYFAKKAFDNILVSPLATGDKLNVHIVSDYLKPIKGVLHVRVIDLKGRLHNEYEAAITLPPNSSKLQYSAALQDLLQGCERNKVVINARFTTMQNGEQQVYTNNYFPSRYKDIVFPKAAIHTRVSASPDGKGYELTLQSEAVARAVFLSIEGIDNFFSDNYVDLLPGEPVTIHVDSPLDQASFERQLKTQTLSD